MKRYAIILAAGKGTRMKSLSEDVSKVSFPILGRPMVRYVLEALKPLGFEKIVTIVGFGGETTKAIVEDSSEVVWQREIKGTGHAVKMVAPVLEKEEGETIICCGDTPVLSSKTLGDLLKAHEENRNDLTVLTSFLEEPTGYGRIVKENGRFVKIVEQKDTNDEEKKIKEVNAGVYVFDNRELFKDLDRLTPNNAAGEYYLTDVIGLFAGDGKKVDTYVSYDIEETMGVNDRYALSKAAKIIQSRINREWMLKGVSIGDGSSTFISPDATIGQDTVIKPGVQILGKTKIGQACVINSYSIIEDAEVKDGEEIPPFTVRKGSK